MVSEIMCTFVGDEQSDDSGRDGFGGETTDGAADGVGS